MALQAPPCSFSIFVPKFSSPSRPRPSTEIRFSRWNNANAQRFLVPERTQKEIEDEIRRERRFQSASNIAENYDSDSASSQNPNQDFKSHGTPSSPSLPSIPGKASKYSKQPQNPKTPQNPRNPGNPNSFSHPAFRRRPIPSDSKAVETTSGGISLGDHGIAYRIPNAPFEFQYSYTETPKVKPLAVREPYLPFGPRTMMRPWTGRKPLPASKKKLPEFDSFRLPPPNKRGVKPVQAPGPFMPGSRPRYATSREEILGEPLTEEERKDLIKGCLRTRRMLHMGRDGLTHNMLENIHAHWKRRRVCKIKCLGVCTVDMDNVCQQLEEKTGGKIIYSRGGILYLFRGRNYNSKTRPKFPLMLWKPMTPVYPRLVKRVPEGLTLEEATEMHERGQKLPPICKLGKNGVYSNLVKNVREAFEECDLVRINCQGMNKSDYKKIGAKLTDLVPCVLISFQHEHILMWRGKDWRSCFPKLEDMTNTSSESPSNSGSANSSNSTDSCLVSNGTSDLGIGKSSGADDCPERSDPVIATTEDACLEETEDTLLVEKNNQLAATNIGYNTMDVSVSSVPSKSLSSCPEVSFHNGVVVAFEDERVRDEPSPSVLAGQGMPNPNGFAIACPDAHGPNKPSPSLLIALETENHTGFAVASEDGQSPNELSPSVLGDLETSWEDGKLLDQQTPSTENSKTQRSIGSSSCTEGVLLLLRQAVESGSALILDNDSLDGNIVYERAVALAKTAPPGPIFRNRFRKVVVKKGKRKEHHDDWKLEEVEPFSEIVKNEKKSSKGLRKDAKYEYQDVIPQGSLGVDELAKLLS